MEQILQMNAHKQALDSLGNYAYSLKHRKGEYSLTIFDDKLDVAYFEISSDFFTLMQYFYKWERGQNANKT